MTIPDRVTAEWIATRADNRLVTLESRLHGRLQWTYCSRV